MKQILYFLYVTIMVWIFPVGFLVFILCVQVGRWKIADEGYIMAAFVAYLVRLVNCVG